MLIKDIDLISLQNRYEKMVIKTDNCWDWNGHKSKGYGRIMIKRYTTYAHRVSWILNFGPIPDKLFVLHKCDNPPCSRPDHLFLGTNKDNSIDRDRKGRYNHNRQYRKGENCYNAKLNKDKVLLIYQLLEKKENQAEIARSFGISMQTVSDIKYGRIWKDLYAMENRSFYNHREKLSKKVKREIKKLLNNGERVCNLMRKYEVSKPTIQRIRNREDI